jgi:hypothetical protein
VIEEISGRGAHMTHRSRSLKLRSHHNIRAGNHGNVRKRKDRTKITHYSAPSVTRIHRICGTDIPAIHYRPDTTAISVYSIQFI